MPTHRVAEQMLPPTSDITSSTPERLNTLASALPFVLTRCARLLEEEGQLRQRQADLAMRRRAEEAAQKAAILQSRIDRGARVRRARQLKKERQAAKKADGREAAVEAARRYKWGRARFRRVSGEQKL